MEISEHHEQHIIDIVIILQIVKCVNLRIWKESKTYEQFYFQIPQNLGFSFSLLMYFLHGQKHMWALSAKRQFNYSERKY